MKKAEEEAFGRTAPGVEPNMQGVAGRSGTCLTRR